MCIRDRVEPEHKHETWFSLWWHELRWSVEMTKFGDLSTYESGLQFPNKTSISSMFVEDQRIPCFVGHVARSVKISVWHTFRTQISDLAAQTWQAIQTRQLADRSNEDVAPFPSCIVFLPLPIRIRYHEVHNRFFSHLVNYCPYRQIITSVIIPMAVLLASSTTQEPSLKL